jgi:hypothetical protein
VNGWWQQLTSGWSPTAQRWAARGISVLVGLLLAVVLHYVLYRIGLPSKPFIYVAF